MSITLSQVLMLVGPLDDSPGFDAPRERFRRFLTEHVADVATLRALVEDAQRLIGEQPHRALQDTLVLLGRFLGFETTFGSYQRLAGAVQYEGQWRSRHRLVVLLETRTEQTQRVDPDEMTRALAALAANTLDDAPRIGMSVVTPLFAARGRLDEEQLAAAATGHEPAGAAARTDRRIVSTRSLLWLADAVGAGKMTHDEVATLLLSGQSIDTVVGLLARFSSTEAARTSERRQSSDRAVEPPAAVQAAQPAVDPAATSFWAVTVERSQSANFEQIVQSAVGKRHVLGVAEDRTLPAVAQAGDSVCFFLPGKGVVGHAEIAGAADAGLQLIRGSDRYSRLYKVKNVSLYEMPIVPDLDTQQTLVAHHQRAGVPGPLLVPVAEHKFQALTTGPTPAERPTVETGPLPAIDRASRSRV